MITKNCMTYKESCRNDGDIITKLRVIKEVRCEHRPHCDVARQFGMHRNTVWPLIALFESQAPPELQKKIDGGISMTALEMKTLGAFLWNTSRRPKGNKRCATRDEEQHILDTFESLGGVGSKRLYQYLSRSDRLCINPINGTIMKQEERREKQNMIGISQEAPPKSMTVCQIRWVLKRAGKKVQKVRVYNGTHKPLYNYALISAFENMHLDTKVLADQKSLPEHVYKALKGNTQIPIYEWNIIDAKTRTRFIAYSRGHSSTFWLQFLVFVISHLRYCGITISINLWTDNGAEFFSGCAEKKQEWNDLLWLLNARIENYHPNWDVRKNLIERSHRSDDEELLIPFWDDMTIKERFLYHTKAYQKYWNTTRVHSGIGMNGMTPREKLVSLWVLWVPRILDFPTLILDDSFLILQEHLNYFQWQLKLKQTDRELLRNDPKTRIDLTTCYPHLQRYAQNVFAYYRFCMKFRFFVTDLTTMSQYFPSIEFYESIESLTPIFHRHRNISFCL